MGRKLIAGNWKMNGLRKDGLALAGELAEKARSAGDPGCDLLVCPPATLLIPVAGVLEGSPLALGGQDCAVEEKGAYTGDVSAAMLADAGCEYVILGHSERRAGHGEPDVLVKAKAEAALAAGLIPIVCVGESQAQREAGEALKVIEGQVRASLPGSFPRGRLVLAYEPVWAIGTGKVATPGDVAEVHDRIRALLGELLGESDAKAVRLLYGGSVKPDNAGELLALENVDGALVGGASLKAGDFWGIAQAAP